MPVKAAPRWIYQGKPHTLQELERISSWSMAHLWRRLNQKKMPVEEAVRPLKSEMGKPVTVTPPTSSTYTHEGVTYHIVDLAQRAGVSTAAMRYRLFVGKWPFDKAMTTEKRVRPTARMMTVTTPEGEKTMSMKEWSAYRDIRLPTISQRLIRGWTEAQALEYEPPPPTNRYGNGKKRKKTQP